MKSLLLMALLISNSFANDRVDYILTDDSTTRLNHIEEIKLNLISAKSELNNFEKALTSATKTESRQKVFIVVRNTAAISSAIALAVTGSLFYKATRPAKSEGALYQLLASYGGVVVTGATALIAGGAEIGVYFSKNEAVNLRINMKSLQKNLDSKQNELKNEINLLCKEEPRHKLCY